MLIAITLGTWRRFRTYARPNRVFCWLPSIAKLTLSTRQASRTPSLGGPNTRSGEAKAWSSSRSVSSREAAEESFNRASNVAAANISASSMARNTLSPCTWTVSVRAAWAASARSHSENSHSVSSVWSALSATNRYAGCTSVFLGCLRSKPNQSILDSDRDTSIARATRLSQRGKVKIGVCTSFQLDVA